MSSTDLTTTEVLESLTGFDEIAIAKAFGSEVLDLAQDRATTFMRAMVFIVKRREGMKDAAANEAALEMTLKDVQAYFADEPDDAMPAEPDSPSGKDAAQLETEPAASPASVSRPA